MDFLSRFSPFRAFRDLRAFLRSRRPHEVGFMALSIALTWTMILMFSIDTDNIKKDYVAPEIIYVQDYAENRTDAEILAQQAIDLPKEKARAKALTDAQQKRQEEFKRLDDKLKSWGL
ncbi:MAG: hypothetical protein EOP62_05040 [Sphingomonadales bacterium]|nr:MAG: hypothetical protein EOP62_05040 [Sphingomonadales bacterium]